MFRLSYSIFIVILVACYSCKCHKKSTAGTDTVSSEIPAAVNDTNMRFIVSFYSIGSGSEPQQMDSLRNFVAGYGKKVNKNIPFENVRWGREGELDFCFKLKELTADQQKDFIKGAKEVLKTAQWVHYSENVPCRKAEVRH